jgi:geranylgeranyl diphosphate synthase type II
MNLQIYLQQCRQRVDKRLAACLADVSIAPELQQAMHYSVLNGGKRVRPCLAYAACEVAGGLPQQVDHAACAVELIHAYSLIHDDLPAMDDDDLRRGRPTCHKKFGEDIAILAGDALQALAFEQLLSVGYKDSDSHIKATLWLARAAGANGLVGGQAIDLGAARDTMTLPALEEMHNHKTGALVKASISIGALLGGGQDTLLRQLQTYAETIGLAFQVKDDILDVEADTHTLGKPQGSDAAKNKATFPALLGLSGAQQKLNELHTQALDALNGLGAAADSLRELATYIVNRQF